MDSLAVRGNTVGSRAEVQNPSDPCQPLITKSEGDPLKDTPRKWSAVQPDTVMRAHGQEHLAFEAGIPGGNA